MLRHLKTKLVSFYFISDKIFSIIYVPRYVMIHDPELTHIEYIMRNYELKNPQTSYFLKSFRLLSFFQRKILHSTIQVDIYLIKQNMFL